MIRLIFGNVGSGKTASVVRYMRQNPHKEFYTNINVNGKDFRHVHKLKAEMIIKKEQIGTKRDGKPIYELKLNTEFWRDMIEKKRKINIVIDEAHIFLNPRRSMSKLNIIMTDFLALLRRVLGSSDNSGELILITQLSRRLDVIAKEMSTQISYCVHHFKTRCSKCYYTWSESNENPNRQQVCPACRNWKIARIESMIEVRDFKNIEHFMRWHELHEHTYFRRYLITDIVNIFGNYDTLQFEDMFSEY
jgi:thymidine kinase